ncbi:MAG TPA: glycoside hydrolase family 57 protein [Ktedonobacterales bacterium]|nr:glycoside hydrolase family 57 protein [Ktedonobacterales bacterium]
MIHVALLWHQHQPIYKRFDYPTPRGSYQQPWVRLHALRDYYAMAALVAAYPVIHLTFNLTPALLWQLEDYSNGGATDRAQELTLTPAEALSPHEREELFSTFFEADWHHQIFPHPRYAQLFQQRQDGQPFSGQDVRDLQMWFNLAWFGTEMRIAEQRLITGETVTIHRFVDQGRDFTMDDLAQVIAEQQKVLRAIIPLHRTLQEAGQIEVSTTPFNHPILPLIIDTDDAQLERPADRRPRRFAHPDDAEAQIEWAVEAHARWFGQPPRGMWPAEGAVSQASLALYARHGVRWIASDQGVLARSGKWGYRADDPAIGGQPYRAEENGDALSIFFRDAQLSNAIGFHYAKYASAKQAADDFVCELRARGSQSAIATESRVVTVILDGENAWGAYPEDARPFLHELYKSLAKANDIRTVTFSEVLAGNAARGIAAHPLATQHRVYDLFTGSWIDAWGSYPGVDLDTWIGQEPKSRGWELLGLARNALAASGATPQSAPQAFQAIYAAEGSDWFWWLGDDHAAGNNEDFDDLFRAHLQAVYGAIGQDPPAILDEHLMPHAVIWRFTHPLAHLQLGDRLTIRTNCPGQIEWWLDGEPATTIDAQPVGGVRRYHVTLGPFSDAARALHFRFRCTDPVCDGSGPCCKKAEIVLPIIVQPVPVAGR